MIKCKLCDMLPNFGLELMLKDGVSSRKIADQFDIGKSTVIKHRAENHTPDFIQVKDMPEQTLDFIGDKGTLSTGLIETDLSGMSHEAILSMFGHNPNKVEITGLIHESHKEYYNRDLGKKLWKHSYRFSVQKIVEKADDAIDPIELIKELGFKSRPVAAGSLRGDDSTFVLDWADWQVCKAEGGGTEGFIRRFDSAMDAALARILELKLAGRKLDELVIIGGGDMIEGCTIYPQQSFGIDGHRRQQIRVTVATILKGLYILAPYFKTVRVVVVPGNHGENRINGYRTALGDNDDLLVFEMAETGIKNDPNMKHVFFEIAEDEMSIATDIRGWIYGVTHGDVYGRGSGNGIRNKVFNWFKTMAANRHVVGSADVLVTHHFHHLALEDWGATLWIQNPTMDGGSHYFVEATGHKPKHGMNSWVVTEAERFQDHQVLR